MSKFDTFAMAMDYNQNIFIRNNYHDDDDANPAKRSRTEISPAFSSSYFVYFKSLEKFHIKTRLFFLDLNF